MCVSTVPQHVWMDVRETSWDCFSLSTFMVDARDLTQVCMFVWQAPSSTGPAYLPTKLLNFRVTTNKKLQIFFFCRFFGHFVLDIFKEVQLGNISFSL